MIKKLLRKFGYIHKDDICEQALYALRLNATKKVAIHSLCRQLNINLNEYIIRCNRIAREKKE